MYFILNFVDLPGGIKLSHLKFGHFYLSKLLVGHNSEYNRFLVIGGFYTMKELVKFCSHVSAMPLSVVVGVQYFCLCGENIQ